MSPTVIHRQAGPADAEQLLPLIASYYAHDHLHFDQARIREGLQFLLADPAVGRIYLLESHGAAVGYTLFTFGFDLEFGGRLALLTDLYVQPAFQRRGFGMATLRFLEHLLPTLGVGALELQVERANLPAQALYRAFGFQALDRLPLSKALSPLPG
jgi:ribosomal protein S18 acetylase RimI-like enzyme